MEITGKNFTHLMQYTSVLASLQHTGMVVICCINSRECTKYMNICYDRISRQKWQSLSFPSLSNTQSLAQSSSRHRPQAHSTHSLSDWSRRSSYVVKAHTTFTIIIVIHLVHSLHSCCVFPLPFGLSFLPSLLPS